MPREKFLEDTKDAHAVLTMLSDKVDEEFLSNAPEMKVVANLAVGFDNIDLDAAERHEVVITNTLDVLTETTAELAFTLMLVSARNVIAANKELVEATGPAGARTTWPAPMFSARRSESSAWVPSVPPLQDASQDSNRTSCTITDQNQRRRTISVQNWSASMSCSVSRTS